MRRLILMAVLLCAEPATAGVKGSVGAASDYLFRGIEGSGGAAVQGDIYYAADEGYYLGGWISNALNATNQIDTYAGYDYRGGDYSLGGGLVYRYFSQEADNAAFHVRPQRISYPEIFVSGGLGPGVLAVYYGHDYFGTSKDSLYVSGEVTLPVSETVSVILQGGYNAGPGTVELWGRRFFDYRVSLEKKLDSGFSAAFHLAGTTRNASAGGFSVDDRPKFLVSFKKEFDF